MKTSLLNIVRQNDPDRFLLSLMVPRTYREALWAIFAFDVEVAKTKYVVTDATIGRIRLQWWRDAIDEIYQKKNVRRHEIVEPLAKIIRRYDLPQDLFDQAIRAREAEFMPDDIIGKKCFENYCLQTTQASDELVCRVLDIQYKQYLSVSQNFGVMRALMTVPKQLSHGMLLLPTELLSKHDLSCQKILDYRRYDDLKPLVKEVLETGFVDITQKPKDKYFGAMHKLTMLIVNHIKKQDGDVFVAAQKPIAFKALRLWLA